MNEDNKVVKTDAEKIKEILEFAVLMYNYTHKKDPWVTLNYDQGRISSNIYAKAIGRMRIASGMLATIADIAEVDVVYHETEEEVHIEHSLEHATGIRKSASIDFDKLK